MTLFDLVKNINPKKLIVLSSMVIAGALYGQDKETITTNLYGNGDIRSIVTEVKNEVDSTRHLEIANYDSSLVGVPNRLRVVTTHDFVKKVRTEKKIKYIFYIGNTNIVKNTLTDISEDGDLWMDKGIKHCHLTGEKEVIQYK